MGIDGKRSIHRDLKGGIAYKNINYISSKNGKNIYLTIDRQIQYIAYKYLKEGVINNNATAGSAIIINVSNGEVLAMVNYPAYNPNNMTNVINERIRNRIVTDVYEPGSVMKPFAAVAALTSGKYDVNTIVDTSPGYYYLNGNLVKDFRNYGKIDLRHILMKSSNIGISRIILSLLDTNALSDTLYKFGFGEITGISFPGERSGYVPKLSKWSKFSLATLSFGYNMNATILQLAQAYSTIANGGKLIRPILLKKSKENKNFKEFKVINEEISKKMINMLTSVIEDRGGTASKARIQKYHVAGKTGTTKKSIAGGYSKNNYIATFVGISPALNPKIVTIVVLDEPKGKTYSGGSSAAPIFVKITEHVLHILGIPTDKVILN